MVLGESNKQLIKFGSSLSRSQSLSTAKVSLEDEYSHLDPLEREFCLSKAISCKDFYAVKQTLLLEQAKNAAIAHQILRERGRAVAACKESADVIFDFLVKDNSTF